MSQDDATNLFVFDYIKKYVSEKVKRQTQHAPRFIIALALMVTSTNI